MRLTISVNGRPAPQGSKQQGSAGQLLEQSPYLPAWRTAVKIGAYRAYQSANIRPDRMPLFPVGVPVFVELCTFYVGAEQCQADGTVEPVGVPDIDKLLRSTLDALGGQRTGSARLFADDSQVVKIDGLSKQRTSSIRPNPGALIIVSDGRE